MVIVAAFVPIKNDLHNITINIVSFKFHSDQILHAVVYFLIYMYFPVGQYLGLQLFNKNAFKKLLVVMLVLATVTEAIQLFVPSRAFNFFDWVANVIGIVIGLIVIKSVRIGAEG
jgi:VanZ family protein